MTIRSVLRTFSWSTTLACAALSVCCAEPQAQPASLIGTWEYRQANSASPTGLDPEGERITFRRSPNGDLAAEYFGLERAGDAGLFYTAVEVTGLKQEPDGTVHFNVPGRRLFRKRPKDIKETSSLESAGQTNFVMSLSGALSDGTLVLACAAGGDSCPEPRMVFRRAGR